MFPEKIICSWNSLNVSREDYMLLDEIHISIRGEGRDLYTPEKRLYVPGRES